MTKALTKTAWWINTDKNWKDRWSKKSIKSVTSRLDFYQQNVKMLMLDCDEIKSRFWPLYRETIMIKDNYHLTEDFITASIDKISQDPGYKLMWFQSLDGEGLGGNVIHIFPDLVKGVYRTYNHQRTRELEFRDFDYYADFMLQDYVSSVGIERLSRGLMAHPCDNIGLVVFKLRTGAVPCLPVKKIYREIGPHMIEDRVNAQQNYAFFSDPDEQGYFKRITVYMREENEVATQLKNVCERMKIEVDYKFI